MKEHPILFSGEMVRAILGGRKTQTRRVIKPQPEHGLMPCCWNDTGWGIVAPANEYGVHGCTCKGCRCPYGQPDDLLWVRETWQDLRPHQDRVVYAATPGDVITKWRPSIHMPRWASRITLRVVDVRVERLQEISHDDAYSEGIDTDIWDQAAVARNYAKPDSWFQMWSSDLPDYVDLDNLYIESFRTLWDSINAARGHGWDVNPWVWVVEFEHQPEGAR